MNRRHFLSLSSASAMVAGLAAGYGMLAAIAGRFLYPARGMQPLRLLIGRASDVEVGGSIAYQTPDGHPVSITRRSASGTVEDFIALSSTCPHLGCQVHWEPQNDRYFCPCHNGTFDPSGRGTGGPPGDAGQSLPQYPLILEGNLLFIEVPEPVMQVRAPGGRGAPRL